MVNTVDFMLWVLLKKKKKTIEKRKSIPRAARMERGKSPSYWVDVGHGDLTSILQWTFSFSLICKSQSLYKSLQEKRSNSKLQLFPWTKNWVHKQNTTPKTRDQELPTAEFPSRNRTILNYRSREADPILVGFAHRTPKFSRYSWKKKKKKFFLIH